MPSRRYPQLMTHTPVGKLLAQPVWLAPKLHRGGEVMDVYGARRRLSVNLHGYPDMPHQTAIVSSGAAGQTRLSVSTPLPPAVLMSDPVNSPPVVLPNPPTVQPSVRVLNPMHVSKGPRHERASGEHQCVDPLRRTLIGATAASLETQATLQQNQPSGYRQNCSLDLSDANPGTERGPEDVETNPSLPSTAAASPPDSESASVVEGCEGRIARSFSLDDLPILEELERLETPESTGEVFTHSMAQHFTPGMGAENKGDSDRGLHTQETVEHIPELIPELEALSPLLPVKRGGDMLLNLPFSDEDLNLLNAFASVATASTGNVEATENGVENGLTMAVTASHELMGAQQVVSPEMPSLPGLSVEEQISRIVGLDRSFVNHDNTGPTDIGLGQENLGLAPGSAVAQNPVDIGEASVPEVNGGDVTNRAKMSDCMLSDVSSIQGVNKCATAGNATENNAQNVVGQRSDKGANNQSGSGSGMKAGAQTAWTTGDYGKLHRLMRERKYPERGLIAKMFPGRAYEDVLQKIQYYFPSVMCVERWDEAEEKRLFAAIGRVVDWDCVASRMRGRDREQVRQYFWRLVRNGEFDGRPNMFQN